MRSDIMTSGYGDKEREFLNALEADTGRTLAQWMEAIRAEGLDERNDIIDWLRRQGFRFSRASWLERVHHNDGKPIYADRPVGDRASVRRAPARAPDRRPERTIAAPRPAVLGSALLTPVKLTTPVVAKPAAARPAADAYAAAATSVMPLAVSDPLSPQITELTAKAKAYRPLADFLLREIAKAVPAATFSVRGTSIAIASDGREFASLAVSARELKLAVAQSGPIALTDARQVDTALLARIGAAAGTTA